SLTRSRARHVARAQVSPARTPASAAAWLRRSGSLTASESRLFGLFSLRYLSKRYVPRPAPPTVAWPRPRADTPSAATYAAALRAPRSRARRAAADAARRTASAPLSFFGPRPATSTRPAR